MAAEVMSPESPRHNEESEYDPNKIYGAMHMSEVDLNRLAQFSGMWCTFTADYAHVVTGQIVVIETVKEEYEPHVRLIVRLNATVNAALGMEGVPGDPPAKLFEASVLKSSRSLETTTGDVFGALFPDGSAVLVDMSPIDE